MTSVGNRFMACSLAHKVEVWLALDPTRDDPFDDILTRGSIGRLPHDATVLAARGVLDSYRFDLANSRRVSV